MRRWFRWYDGTSEDVKFRVVTRMSRVTLRDVIALWACMLEDASHLEHRGTCTRNATFLSAALDFTGDEVERILSAMENLQMIAHHDDGLSICNWSKRQFESDTDPTAAERQRNKRKRDQQAGHTHVTRDSRPPDTDTDTDTDTERKKDIGAVAIAPPLDQSFEELWSAYPKRQGANPKVPAQQKFQALVKAGVPPSEILSGAQRYAAELRRLGQVGTPYVAQMITWLNQSRWRDEYAQPPPRVVGI